MLRICDLESRDRADMRVVVKRTVVVAMRVGA